MDPTCDKVEVRKAYAFHPDTHEYVGETTMVVITSEDGETKFCDSENKTLVRYPTQSYSNLYGSQPKSQPKTFVFEEERNEWVLTDDNRMFRYALDDYGTYTKVLKQGVEFTFYKNGKDPTKSDYLWSTTDQLGPLPEGAIRRSELLSRSSMLSELNSRFKGILLDKLDSQFVRAYRCSEDGIPVAQQLGDVCVRIPENGHGVAHASGWIKNNWLYQIRLSTYMTAISAVYRIDTFVDTATLFGEQFAEHVAQYPVSLASRAIEIFATIHSCTFQEMCRQLSEWGTEWFDAIREYESDRMEYNDPSCDYWMLWDKYQELIVRK